ncbi:MAG: hypothetical protein HEQ35_08865 [Gloeotrichia echinulata IR180]|jgi:hypothetical protein
MKKLIDLGNLLSYFIEFIIREKRLPQKLTENYFFHFPGYARRRFEQELKHVKSEGTTLVYLPNLQQRYVYQLLHIFSLSFPQLIFLCKENNIKEYINLGYEGRRIFSIKNLKVVSTIPDIFQADVVVICDNNENNENDVSKFTAKKTQIIIETDVSQKPKTESFMLPYGIHPYFLQNHEKFNTDISQLRLKNRSISIFFSGNTRFLGDKHLVERYYSVPSRERCVQFLTENSTILNICVIQKFKERKNFNDNPNKYKDYSLVFCTCKGLPEKWLNELSNANFFLALPGGYMLMCHNAIEAMAVGTIPILSYEHWFFPPLINGETCLTYKCLEEIPQVIAYANKLKKNVIEKMREAVINYYDRYLSVLRVVDFLQKYEGSKLHLYINHEEAETLRKVTDKSILSCGGSLQALP